MPYAQSDWNSAQRSDYTSVLYDMVYTNSLNTVSSRDIELLRAQVLTMKKILQWFLLNTHNVSTHRFPTQLNNI